MSNCEVREIVDDACMRNKWNSWAAKIYLFDLLPLYSDTGCFVLMEQARNESRHD